MDKLNHQLTIVLGVIEYGGKFLILRRVDPDENAFHQKWELPGGRIEPGESPLEAFKREILEETSLNAIEPTMLGIHTHHWDLPDRVQQTFLIVYRASVEGDKVQLRDDENDDYRWVTLDEFFNDYDHLQANRDMIEQLYKPLLEGESQ